MAEQTKAEVKLKPTKENPIMKSAVLSLFAMFLASAAWAEDMKSVTISSAAKEVMTVSAPQDAKITVSKEEKSAATKEKTAIDTKYNGKAITLYLWVVPKAKTVAGAISHIDDVIKSEVLNFKPDSTETITVAGAEAKHLKGKSVEADDQDPGTTDVVVFKVGKTVCVACVHGEHEMAAKQRQPMLDALKTVKAP
jgi:hypothetical protein